MKITVNLDTQAIITQPSPLRFKGGCFNPVEIAFTRSSSSVPLPSEAVIELSIKPKKLDGDLLAYLNLFTPAAGNLYTGSLNCATTALLAALEVGQIEASAEVTWSFGGWKFRSITFTGIIEPPVTDDEVVASPDPELYPTPAEVARKSDIPTVGSAAGLDAGVPNGAAILDGSGKLLGTQVPISVAMKADLETLPATGSKRIVIANRMSLGSLPTDDANGNTITKVNVGDVVHQTGTSGSPHSAVVSFSQYVVTDDDVNYWSGVRFTDESGTTASFCFTDFGGPGTVLSPVDLTYLFTNAINGSGMNVNASITDNGQVTITGPVDGWWAFAQDQNVASYSETAGTSALPSGEFIVADINNLGNAMGYQGIGNTVDFLSGYGAPTLDIGEEGNGYVDQNNGDFYHRDASGWQFVLNIKGPQGDRGEQGPIGIGDLRPPSLNITKLALKQWPNSMYCNIGGWPQGICFDGANIWVTSNNAVTKIAVSTASIVGTYNVGNLPFDVCFDGTNIWTANYNSNNVTKLLASNGSVVGTYPVGSNPFAVCFDGTHIWTANSGNRTVSKILASNGSLVGTYDVGLYPEGICFDGTNIWVTNNGSSTVTKLLASNGSVIGNYAIGSYSAPWGVCFDGTYIWVVASSASQVFKLLASTGAFVGAYSVGSLPSFICFDGMNIWVTLQSESCIAKIAASTGALVGKYPTAVSPHGNCFDGTNIWVTGGNGVTKI